MPQGSVFGPILFSLYEQPKRQIIKKHGLPFHHYADDIQILITFDLNIDSLLDAIRRLEECFTELKTWMTAAHCCRDSLSVLVRLESLLWKNVRNVGAYLDMSHNVVILLKSCYFHRKVLPRNFFERVVNAMITSCIDYCNALLYGTSGKNHMKLQRLQNVSAKIILGGSRYEIESTGCSIFCLVKLKYHYNMNLQ